MWLIKCYTGVRRDGHSVHFWIRYCFLYLHPRPHLSHQHACFVLRTLPSQLLRTQAHHRQTKQSGTIWNTWRHNTMQTYLPNQTNTPSVPQLWIFKGSFITQLISMTFERLITMVFIPYCIESIMCAQLCSGGPRMHQGGQGPPPPRAVADNGYPRRGVGGANPRWGANLFFGHIFAKKLYQKYRKTHEYPKALIKIRQEKICLSRPPSRCHVSWPSSVGFLDLLLNIYTYDGEMECILKSIHSCVPGKRKACFVATGDFWSDVIECRSKVYHA